MADGMPLSGGVERLEAEAALAELMSAQAIQADSKLMKAVEDVRVEKINELERFDPNEPVKMHPDSNREGKVDF